MISSTPEAAYEMCTEYCPPCDQPFKYSPVKIPSMIVQPKPERLNTTNSNTKPKEAKHSKKKKKNFQALESQYTSLDIGTSRSYDDIDEEEYEESDDEDENENSSRFNHPSPELNIITVTRPPIYENNVSKVLNINKLIVMYYKTECTKSFWLIRVYF